MYDINNHLVHIQRVINIITLSSGKISKIPGFKDRIRHLKQEKAPVKIEKGTFEPEKGASGLAKNPSKLPKVLSEHPPNFLKYT
jgi:hypothetical protein